MKYYEKIHLCLTEAEYTACFGPDAYKNHKKRGQILVYGLGGNGREVLIDYETLAPERKAKITAKYGDPYQYVVKQPLIEWVQLNWNTAAFDFYKSYPLTNGLNLPEGYRDKYTKAITYLHAIHHYTTDKLALKRDFNITMDAFWKIVADVLTAEDVDLPKRRERLTKVLSEYKKAGFNTPAGYELRIEKFRFGNGNSKKVKESAEDVLMKLIELDNKHDDVVIASSYNIWAKKHDHPTITPATVGYRRRNHYHEVALARDGRGITYETYNKQIKQRRPSSPLMLVNSDDNVLDLYFKEVKTVKGKKVVNHWYRPVMYVVLDPFNDYVLGYAVGEVVTIDLIKAAYRNAMAHVVELTGAPYLWHQIKSDKWAIDPNLEGELATFFKSQAIFFPASVARSKYIERTFGTPLHKILKAFPNYSGANITAKGKNARPNPDALQKRAKDFPDKAYDSAVIQMAINAMRHKVINEETGETLQSQWLTAFHESDFCKGKVIGTDRKLELFGIRHAPKEPVRLSPAGVTIYLNSTKFNFDIPARLFPEYNGRRVEVIYDPNDMGEALITDGKGLRFVTSTYYLNPSCVADMRPGEGKLLQQQKDDSKEITRTLQQYVIERNERLTRAQIDAQSLIQAGVLTKSVNHQAQKVVGGYQDFETPLLDTGSSHEFNIYDQM